MPDLVHQLDHIFGGADDECTYRVTFGDGDVFRLRQLTLAAECYRRRALAPYSAPSGREVLPFVFTGRGESRFGRIRDGFVSKFYSFLRKLAAVSRPRMK